MPSIRQAVNDAIEVSPENTPPRLQHYLDCIASYEKEFKSWESRVDKILKRYRDEKRDNRTSGTAKFNILWSNVQTLVPATFSRLPQPDVSRRFRDNDPVGRVAALILERALEYEVKHYADYRTTMRQSVTDRFLGGRGTCWARYEPHFTKTDAQVTEDSSDAPVNEQLDYECAPTDYVHWKDFGHSIARTWEEVTLVWRKVYMSAEAVTQRFGKEVAAKIPYDATPEDLKRTARESMLQVKKQALIYEMWDKETGTAVWLNKSMQQPLDEREDPLGLHDFFPCPKPLFATTTNETLVPVPDFTLYQDQANELDILTDRIDGLAKMLQVKGVYDASADPAIARLFTEGENGTLMPMKNWAAFAEKQGLKGQLDVLDLTMIATALEQAYLAMEQVKNQVYEITGISDIIRGQTDARETATAQQVKGQFATLRLKSMQEEVARYATEILRLKAQIICTKFAPQTIAAMAAVEQLTPEDQQVVPQALALLVGEQRLMDPEAEDGPNPMRSFRIDIAADTLVELDEQQEKADRMEMLKAFGTYLKSAAEVGAMAPPLIPLIVEVGKFGLQAFKVGKSVEGTFDTALDQLKQMAGQPQVDPEQMKKQIEDQVRAELEMKNASKEVKLAQREADLDVREMKFTAQQEIAAQQQQFNEQAMQQQQQFQQKEMEQNQNFAAKEQEFAARESEMNQKAQARELEAGVSEKLVKHKSDVDQTVAKVKQETAQASADEVAVQAAEQKNAKREQQTEKLVMAVVESTQALQEDVKNMVKAVTADAEIVRDEKGKAKGIRRKVNA